MVFLLMLWESWVWFDSRRATKYISGLDLPQAAQFIESFGSRNEPVYVWSLDQATLRIIGPDAGQTWKPFDQSFFGSLEPEQVSPTAEVCYYRTSFWSVALYRDLTAGRLTIAGIYTN
jgi:hypothetical protein